MEILIAAIVLGFIIAGATIIFCLASKSKEGTIYCSPSYTKTKCKSIKNVNIDGFLK